MITDSGVRDTGVPDRIHAQLVAAGIKAEVFDRVAIEPTDQSIDEAVAWAREQDWDCFIAVGGGSAIDTAKAVNLLTTHPGELLDFVTPPIGAGKAPWLPVKPLIAVPTTAGTGFGVDHDLRRRLSRPAPQGRREPPEAAPDPRRRRPADHRLAARRR